MRPVHHISVSLGCDFGVPILLDVAKVVVDHARRQCSPPEEGGELMKRREMKAALLPSALLICSDPVHTHGWRHRSEDDDNV